MNEIEKLRQENAELKAKIIKYAELNEIDTRDYAALHNENIKLNAIIDGYQPKIQRYKDILQEIKEIAENTYEMCAICGNAKYFKKIIDIINKAEV